jgi:hypothetical protein
MAIAPRVVPLPTVHAESVRVGIRLTYQTSGQPIPSAEVVERILAAGRKQLDLHEFPLEVIGQQTLQRREVRRAVALKALEVLLQKGSDGFGDDNGDEKAVDRAWAIAAMVERHENAGKLLDVLSEKGTD